MNGIELIYMIGVLHSGGHLHAACMGIVMITYRLVLRRQMRGARVHARGPGTYLSREILPIML